MPRGKRIAGFARYIDRRTSTKGYRMTFIAVPLIVGGAVMSVYDRPQELRPLTPKAFKPSITAAGAYCR